jgi:hypothetical protein
VIFLTPHIGEEGFSRDQENVEKLIDKVFRNVTGRELAEKLFLA